ncbi:DUF3597 domain-containing protein [Denitrificimonas caeni]|uniref:DUF3597 domain-containing protein n=1 Tax=Denitrificimonas caeni TaxID=521720 RepID=A0AAF0AJE5_9GAMM|nr:DUF3597 domain-containing protein [Denitrificimonas caeni]NLJ12290.1 DUF3597 domain-containing protein [Gammaproteobacteria bacterium]WBE24266.1 DUF3597 domain-containing protein [Denitrificimonas caeni]
MGFFNSILSKLGIGQAQAAAADEVENPTAAPTSAAVSTPEAITVVDVITQLEEREAASTQKLNWRVSIVDLLKLLDLDSSFSARKELAVELNCPAELMDDSAKMNMWLHKTVLARIAENGGNIPQSLIS